MGLFSSKQPPKPVSGKATGKSSKQTSVGGWPHRNGVPARVRITDAEPKR